ncbi:MAG: hypothetical protein WCY82_07645 [Desulfotomaculaceae bacterium]
MALKNRVEKLEKSLRTREGDALVIIAPADLANDDVLEVTVNGEKRFVGTKKECDRWINENLGQSDLRIIVGEESLSD